MRSRSDSTADTPNVSNGRPDHDRGVVGTSTDRPSRRRALAMAGTASLAALAGCLDLVPAVGGDQVEIEPEDPGDDPDATPEEFYYLLEENGIIVEEVYHNTDDNDLLLFYESEAADEAESDDEIGLIYLVFRDGLIDRGADINHLYTEVTGNFEGQVEGWGINSEWAEKDLAGDADELAVFNQIRETFVYPEGHEPEGIEIDDGEIEMEPSDEEPQTNESTATTNSTDEE